MFEYSFFWLLLSENTERIITFFFLLSLFFYYNFVTLLIEFMPKVVVIGWGAGTFNVLYGLKQNPENHLSAIIAMCDNGWTAGAIRDKYGILPPWDVRRAVAAMAKNTGMVRKLFEYKFEEDGVIGGNKIGNILLTALHDITWDFQKATDAMCDMFDARWQVIPVTLEDVHLWVRFADGVEVIGEKNIDISDTNPWERTHNPDETIIDAFLVWWEWKLNPRVQEAIENADFIIIWPGDLYTSIVPNLLSKGMREVIQNSRWKKVFMCNIMTKRGETTNMEVIDFVNVIEKYIWENILDFVVVNNGFIHDQIVQKYRDEEGKKPVKLKDSSVFEGKKYQIVEADVVDDMDVVRHSPTKTIVALEQIFLK